MVTTLFLTEKEAGEIRTLARVIFSGGNPLAMDETAEIYCKWSYMFHIFEYLKHPKYGTYIHFPFPGALMQQPFKTMSVFDVMRQIWIEKLQQEINRK